MGRAIQNPVVGQVTRYEGVYGPHWEIGHIGVRVPHARNMIAYLPASLVLLMGLCLGLLGLLGLIDLLVFGGLFIVLMPLPFEERWSPRFPPDFNAGLELEDILEDKGGPIEFEGIVTAPGRYGHMGIMHREVEIVRVLRYSGRRRRARATLGGSP